MQRYRKNAAIRHWFAETHLAARDFIMPIFVREDCNSPQPIASLPGMSQLDLASLDRETDEIVSLGIPAVILFGIPASKDAEGTPSYADDGIVQRAIARVKTRHPDLIVIADLCLCEYTSHGHCGILRSESEFDMLATLDVLGRIAVSYAKAGVDIVAPSGMLDGMVLAIRTALDRFHYSNTMILSYAVKYASSLYGPFRDAAGSSDDFKGDRRHHQMNPTQRIEAMREAELDMGEGTDMLMVKPAGHYLDIIRDVATISDLPVVAYQVSGEYASIMAAASAGVVDQRAAIEESLIAIKRAGAHKIISYFAKHYLKGV
ncbi:MAG: porphobilinogen synthase [bacterium]|nr:porphobilinogen synthase [bacterium]